MILHCYLPSLCLLVMGVVRLSEEVAGKRFYYIKVYICCADVVY